MSNFRFEREELIWAAGLFEGEGSVGLHKSRFTTTPILQLSTTDEDVLLRFHKATKGLGTLLNPTNSGKIAKSGKPYKTVYKWASYRFEIVQAITAAMWPWLGERRKARIIEVMTLEETRGKKYNVNSVKTHCPKGHPYSGDNLFIDSSNGGRRCRICTQEKLQNWKTAHPDKVEAYVEAHRQKRRQEEKIDRMQNTSSAQRREITRLEKIDPELASAYMKYLRNNAPTT